MHDKFAAIDDVLFSKSSKTLLKDISLSIDNLLILLDIKS